jgi:hypothetical protein
VSNDCGGALPWTRRATHDIPWISSDLRRSRSEWRSAGRAGCQQRQEPFRFAQSDAGLDDKEYSRSLQERFATMARQRYACGRMPRCAVLPRGMRQPREAVYTARYEALAGNPPRRPRGVVAGAHVRILDHVRRGSRPRCHFDRAPGCGCERPAQRSCSGESAQYRRCARHAFGWSRSLPSSTRGSSRARCIGSSAKAAGPAPSAHSRLRPSRSRDLAAATARAPA